MWKAWDLAVDMALAQLTNIVDVEKRAVYISSSFFEEQLTAFEVWLRYGNEERQPPEQLPIVLQVRAIFDPFSLFCFEVRQFKMINCHCNIAGLAFSST